MKPGYVYILTNEAMPGLVKIGRTSRDVDIRASELWQTGVPQEFEVFCSFKTPDCVQLEASVHAALREYRVSRSREFFSVSAERAEEEIQLWIELQAIDFGRRYLEENFGFQTAGESHSINMTIGPFRETVSGIVIADLAKEIGCDPRTIADAMERLTAAEIRQAMSRFGVPDGNEGVSDE